MGPGQYPRYTSAVKDGRPWVAQRLTKPQSTTGTRHEHDQHQNFLIMVAGLRDRAMCFQVVQVWLLSRQCGCVRHRRDCREGRASGRARDVDVPVPQIQEQTVEVVKEIPQEIDVEKLMDEDVDETILETDVDDDAQQCTAEPDAAGNGMAVQPEDVSTVTVEVEQPL